MRFWLGILCAAVSGAATWWLSHDAILTGGAALIAALLVWVFGGLSIAVFDI
ncbi:hypothetical protein [Nocardia niwae]|uniref:hypothetical protein n=1 Tax=Nocardia niwae TaxID=626084 RepID=UPI0033ED59EE